MGRPVRDLALLAAVADLGGAQAFGAFLRPELSRAVGAEYDERFLGGCLIHLLQHSLGTSDISARAVLNQLVCKDLRAFDCDPHLSVDHLLFLAGIFGV